MKIMDYFIIFLILVAGTVFLVLASDQLKAKDDLGTQGNETRGQITGVVEGPGVKIPIILLLVVIGAFFIFVIWLWGK